MSELISEAFRLVNFPFTILLILVVMYWLLVAIGALGGEHGDAGVDAHHGGGHDVGHDVAVQHEVDMQHDLDAQHDTSGHGSTDGHDAGHHGGDGGSFWNGVLKFVNLGEVPVMVIVSVLILSGWAISMVTNYYLGPAPMLIVGVCLVGNLLVSMVITRYATMPLKPVFRVLNRDYDPPAKIVGQHCRIVTSEATPSFGQAEIPTNGVPLLIHVRTMNDAVMRRGETAVVVREDGDRRIFFITPNPIPTQA